MDKDKLIELADMEAQADLLAVNGQLGCAVELLKQVNRERARLLGLPKDTDPNALRAMAGEKP